MEYSENYSWALDTFMDAPTKEDTEEFKSLNNGYMHACMSWCSYLLC